MTIDEKLDFVIQRQSEQFAHLEKRLNMIESRLIAMQSFAISILSEKEVTLLAPEDLHELIETTRRQTLSRFSEYPSSRGDLPESFDP